MKTKRIIEILLGVCSLFPAKITTITHHFNDPLIGNIVKIIG